MKLVEGKPMRRTYRGRDDAFKHALNSFEAEPLNLGLSINEYAELMKEAFELLDQSVSRFGPNASDKL
jgi:hypothetical protein